MQCLAFTGPRKLTDAETAYAHYQLFEIWHTHQNATWHVGDAAGLDAIAAATPDQKQLTLYPAENRQPWALQQRSKRMIDGAGAGAVLFAFPNKPCPADLTLSQWRGSGTWGTIRYAKSKGLIIKIDWLCEPCPLPGWMEESQLALF